ncbi:hypothetical protein FBU30_008212 [Linnemannia zychae]|nr:hypothetical protein FBU30_008212 [Linnemannia zychae]
MPPRSFILDRPTKPPLKRVSPSKQKSITPSTYEKKIASNPYAFLTKIIQAAGPNDTPWIVPERILPHAITKISTSESNQEQLRNGPGKWVRTTFDVIDSVVKEGRYKIITTSGFMRTDMSKLIYAQWSIRVAHEFRELFKASTLKSTKTQSSIRQSRFVILDGSHAHPPGSQMSVKTNVTNGNADDDEEKTDLKSILEFRSAQNMEIPCVLYFDKGLQTAFKQVELDSENQENNEATQNRDQNIIQKKPSEIAIATLLGLEQLNEIDITKPTLPASTKDQQPKSELNCRNYTLK